MDWMVVLFTMWQSQQLKKLQGENNGCPCDSKKKKQEGKKEKDTAMVFEAHKSYCPTPTTTTNSDRYIRTTQHSA